MDVAPCQTATYPLYTITEHGVLMYIELLFEYIDRLQEKHDSTRIMSKKKEEIGFKIGLDITDDYCIPKKEQKITTP